MDIPYLHLLLLRGMRAAAGGIFDGFFNVISNVAVDFMPFLLLFAFLLVSRIRGCRLVVTPGIDPSRAMELLPPCGIPGPNVQMVGEGRTVRRIAAFFQEAEVQPEQQEDKLSLAPLNTAQTYLLNWDLRFPGTCMMNLPLRLNTLPGADLEWVAAAVRRAVQAHPILMSTIVEREGRYYLRYDERFDREIPVEEVTPETLEEEALRFAQPFCLDGTPVFRCRILKAGDIGALLLDVYHVVCDGVSWTHLADDIGQCLKGKELSRDQSFSLLREEYAFRNSPRYLRDMEYFASCYDRPGWDTLPRVDHESEENWDESLYLPFAFGPEDAEKLMKQYGFGKNGLFLAAAFLSITIYNGSENVMYSWTWHGRFNRKRTNALGMFMKDLPIAAQLKQELRLLELYETIAEQIRKGVSHASVSYWVEKGSYEGRDLACLLYQGDIYELQESYGPFRNVEYLPTGHTASSNTLDFEILDGKDRFGLLLDYNGAKYERESMERFAGLYCRICEELLRRTEASATVGDVMRAIPPVLPESRIQRNPCFPKDDDVRRIKP